MLVHLSLSLSLSLSLTHTHTHKLSLIWRLIFLVSICGWLLEWWPKRICLPTPSNPRRITQGHFLHHLYNVCFSLYFHPTWLPCGRGLGFIPLQGIHIKCPTQDVFHITLFLKENFFLNLGNSIELDIQGIHCALEPGIPTISTLLSLGIHLNLILCLSETNPNSLSLRT